MPNVVVIGSGLVGLLFCLEYQHRKVPFSLHLYDASDPIKLFDDPRPLVLNGYTQKRLCALGLWPTLQPKTYLLDHLYVSAEKHLGHSHLRASDFDLTALGWVVPAGFLYQTLYNALDQKSVALHTHHALETISVSGDKKIIQFEGRRESVEADFVVAADGAHSKIRSQMQFATQSDGAFYAAVFPGCQVKHLSEIAAHQRFTPHGSVALLPHAHDRATVVWTQRKGGIETDELWQHTLHTWRNRIRFLDQEAPPCVRYDAVMSRPSLYATAGVFLLGNAAHVLPPIAAQGFNLGVRDAVSLCALLSTERAQEVLVRAYQEKRQKDIQGTYEACINAMQLFEPWREAITPIRSMGLWALSSCSQLQQLWLGFGSGYRGSD